MNPGMKISVVILTYNWPRALELSLQSLAGQTRPPDEVAVADDGSTAETKNLVARIARNYPHRLTHLWQEDKGFRAARARNRAIAACRGNYVILLDGDMLVHRDFIHDHEMIAKPGHFVQGTRLRATGRETARLLAGGKPCFNPTIDATFRPGPHDKNKLHYGKRYYALRLPLMARLKARSRDGGHVMSCNMGFWREDLLKVNGFDERMESYGSEDLELAARMENAAIRRRQLKFAGLAIHLEHATRAPDDPDSLSMDNNRLLKYTRENSVTWCEHGIADHLAEFAQAPPDLRFL